MAQVIRGDDCNFNKPLASRGLISYRYRGRFGWIMIGAHSDIAALAEAQRSTDFPVSLAELQVWEGESGMYVDCCPAEVQL